MALWPSPLPRWFWRWSAWVDNDRVGPRPADAPRVIPPWAWARYLVHRGVPAPKPQSTVTLVGIIRTAGNCTPDHLAAQAFLAAGGDKVMLQFRDAQDATNRAHFPEWSARWRAKGCGVDGWWRVDHSPANSPPQVVGVDGWWPNAEDNPEIARLPLIYQAPCAGLICRGKQPGGWPPPGGLLGAECFRENDRSDTTVTNSYNWWVRDSGLPHDRYMALLQAYGEPFARLADQAAEAKRLGVKTLGVYPLDGADPEQIRQLGRVIA